MGITLRGLRRTEVAGLRHFRGEENSPEKEAGKKMKRGDLTGDIYVIGFLLSAISGGLVGSVITGFAIWATWG